MRRSLEWRVTCRWHRLGLPRVPKFVLINQLLEAARPLDRFKYIIVVDDDIALPHRFLDDYLRVVEILRFSLAQPARTHNSVIHHPIVERRDDCIARQTRFVEIGPVFSMRTDAVKLLTPFDVSLSPMGWGFDYAWPVQLGDLRMGIVDVTPVEHVMRPAISGYSGAGDQMVAYLSVTPHLSLEEAYHVLTEYQ